METLDKPLQEGESESFLSPELHERLQHEFEHERELYLRGAEDEYRAMVQRRLLTPQDAEKNYAQERERLAELGTDEQRASWVLNNFRFWLPGAGYRRSFKEVKHNPRANPERIRRHETFARRVDETIARLGIPDDAIARAVDDKSKSADRYETLLRIYFAMRDGGFARENLVK